jgi:hypothetical protein
MPTAAERLAGGAPAGMEAMAFERSTAGPSHSTITSIEIDGDRMVVHENDESFAVPLTAGWSAAGDSMSASTTQVDGRIAVDLALLATPHRLEIELDPASRTYVARWPLMPLFGAGLDPQLSRMHPPTD